MKKNRSALLNEHKLHREYVMSYLYANKKAIYRDFWCIYIVLEGHKRNFCGYLCRGSGYEKQGNLLFTV